MICIRLKNEIKARLGDYKIDGNKDELCNVICTDSLVKISLNDVLSVLSDENTNYIRIGYGQTLHSAYTAGGVVGKTCKLVHIYSYPGKIKFKALYNFINSINNDIIFGYSEDDLMSPGVKLVMIFN